MGLAVPPTTYDVWFLSANTLYRGVPYQVVADWVQQGRLAATDRVCPSGTSRWQTVQECPLLSDYLPRPSDVAAWPITVPPTGGGDHVAAGSGERAAAAPRGLAAAVTADAPEGHDVFERPEPPLFRRSDEDDEVDMVPLIDISMVLLVFFIMIRAAGALAPVDVPEMRYAGQLAADPDALTIVIDKLNADEVYYAVRHGTSAPKPQHDLLPRPEDALRALDELLATMTRPPEVRIACHKSLPYERVIELQSELESRQKKNLINSFVATVVEAPRE